MNQSQLNTFRRSVSPVAGPVFCVAAAMLLTAGAHGAPQDRGETHGSIVPLQSDGVHLVDVMLYLEGGEEDGYEYCVEIDLDDEYERVCGDLGEEYELSFSLPASIIFEETEFGDPHVILIVWDSWPVFLEVLEATPETIMAMNASKEEEGLVGEDEVELLEFREYSTTSGDDDELLESVIKYTVCAEQSHCISVHGAPAELSEIIIAYDEEI